MTLWIMFALGWYLIGVASFIYWWTKDFDLTGTELPIALGVGVLGPLAFIVGAMIHSGPYPIIRRR